MGDYYDLDGDSEFSKRLTAAKRAHEEAVRRATKEALERELNYRATGWLWEFAQLLAALAALWWVLAP